MKVKQVSGCNFDIWCKIVCAPDYTYMCICSYVQIHRLPSELRGFHEIVKGICDGHPPLHMHCFQRLVKAATLGCCSLFSSQA